MRIAERFPPLPTPRRVLVIQLGDIGDVVWSLPALRALRETYPDATISVLLREGGGALLAADAAPPACFEVPRGRAGLSTPLAASLPLIASLRRQRFDLVFDLRGDERGGYMALATGAPVRVAQHFPGLWLRNRLFTHLVALPVACPVVERAAAPSLGILRGLGIKGASAVPRLDLAAAVRDLAAARLAEAGVPLPAEGPGRWVTLNPFSRWSYKEWPPERWVPVIDGLGRERGLETVLVGAAGERERAAAIAAACRARVHNLAGRSTLAELAGILAQSRLHIGVDSAAPHIAAAVGTPTVTLYGPSDWRYWAPPGEQHRVVTPLLACAPCHRKGCEGGGVSRCLDDLAVERVQAAIADALSA